MPSKRYLGKPSKPAKKVKASPAALKSGPLPPYGIAIREALARGDAQELKKTAASARQWLKTIQTALDKLDKAIAKKS